MAKNTNIHEYYNELVTAAKEPTKPYYCYNKDRAHNAAILSAMFNTSNKVKMFCGSMSIFRKEFVNKIGKDEDKYIMSVLADNLKKFAGKENASLEIIVEEYPEMGFSDLIDEETLGKMMDTGTLKLYKLGDVAFKESIPHFTFATPCFVRSEQDKVEHTALCGINNKEFMISSERNFEAIKDLATQVTRL